MGQELAPHATHEWRGNVGLLKAHRAPAPVQRLHSSSVELGVAHDERLYYERYDWP